MARFTQLVTAAVVVAMQVGCSDAATMLQPTDATASRDAARATDLGARRIEMLDACDPTTFNTAVGPGTCTRSGGITFDRFIAQLTQHQKIDAWRFAPSVVEGRVGQTLLAINRGGEVHTFTEVEEFGGGIVPSLNQLSGNPVVAPECLALAPDDFIAPGGSDSDDEVEDGTELYQCCIHPWMRTTVHGHKS
jgi:hypothetical protein